ncbi:ornithine cyclodeaminase [Ilumatobacter sp.]|uniref:ornithine cyclodeaminase n=1 Tax=Ilumatobacter sp. TaxID=1967498 RepID=UPI003B52072C
MIDFVDAPGVARWTVGSGVEAIVDGMVASLERDFRRWQVFDKTPRVASHSEHGVIELMPTSDGVEYAFKYVNGHPINTKRGLQTVTAFGVLADVDTGYPTFMSEMTLLTALRTAATSAMAAKVLAPPDSSTLALIGCGAQAEFQALAFRTTLGIDTLRLWDVDPDAVEKLAANLEPLGFDIHRAAHAADAISSADVITTCTADKTYATILHDDMVGTGVHINAIGGDCPGKTELDPALLMRSDVFVEYTEQSRIEGEIQQLPTDYPVTELWTVLDGSAHGRTRSDQLTVFDSVGFAVEDFSALRYLRDSVRGSMHVTELDLIADPVDPKDLFSLLGGSTTHPDSR